MEDDFYKIPLKLSIYLIIDIRKEQLMKAPNWVNCKNCSNEYTIHCMNCVAKYETANYLNYADKRTITTNTSISQT